MFKLITSLHIPKKRQGYIYYACVNYDSLDAETRETIHDVCRAVVAQRERTAQEAYERALIEYLTTGNSILAISQRHNVREPTLREMRNSFYKMFNKKIMGKDA